MNNILLLIKIGIFLAWITFICAIGYGFSSNDWYYICIGIIGYFIGLDALLNRIK